MRNKTERHHDLDALRGTMLLLGLVIHAGQAYFTNSDGLRDPRLWYFYDETSSPLMAPICGAIHIYRMPVFFVLAGFFAALLANKRGFISLFSNRAKRVIAPLIVAFVTIIPLVYFACQFAWARSGRVAIGYGALSSAAAMMKDNLCHLWFLWHLVLFYFATAFIVLLSKFTPLGKLADRLVKLGRPLLNHTVNSNYGAAICTICSLVFLSQMKELPGNLESSFSFVPPWHLLGIYGLCYFYGWILFGNRARLKQLGVSANKRMLFGVCTATTYLLTLRWYLNNGQPEHYKFVLVLLSAISIWSLIEGWLALFQRYFAKPSPVTRYLSDSSYWVYLIHVPVVLVIQGLLAKSKMAADLKFLIALSTTTFICLASYHLLVRATPIGLFLNGRRYPIWSWTTHSVPEKDKTC